VGIILKHLLGQLHTLLSGLVAIFWLTGATLKSVPLTFLCQVISFVEQSFN
jgi:hypothetical protein